MIDPDVSFNVLAMCLKCKHRWVGNVMPETSLFKLECPKCGKQDSFASFMPADYEEAVSQLSVPRAQMEMH